MQYRPPNVNEFWKKKHVGSVSDSLDRLSVASECMTSVKKLDIIIIMMYLHLILHLQRTHWQQWMLATEL